MRYTMGIRLAAALGLCVAVAALTAQDAPPADAGQQPTFATGTQYVRVDLYVTRDGQPVDDLRLDEITLLEDGVPQAIDRFDRVVVRGPTAFREPEAPLTLERSRRLVADPQSRVIVLLIDPWHSVYVGDSATAMSAQQRFPILRRLEASIGPDDLVAVMVPGMRPDDLTFRRDLGGLAEHEGKVTGGYSIIRPDPGRSQTWDETELLLQTCYGPSVILRRYREKVMLDTLETLSVHLGTLREERKVVLLLTDGWRLYTPDPAFGRRIRDQAGPPPIPRPPIGSPGPGRGRGEPLIVTERGPVTADDAALRRCDAVLSALEALDHRQRFEEIVGAATRNNVAFYPISALGLSAAVQQPGLTEWPPPDASASQTPLSRQADLRALADRTGGAAIVNTNEFTSHFAQVMAHSSAYYLLGYVPRDATLDGRYRRITVQVSRPGVDVRARPGYVAAPPVRPGGVGDAAELVPADRVSAALGRVEGLDVRAPLRLRDAAWVEPVAGQGTAGGFWLVGDLDARVRREPAWTVGATTEITVLAPDGETVFTSRVAMPAVGPAFAVRVPETRRLPPGEYTVRVRTRPAGPAARGAGTGPIDQTLRVAVPAEASPLGDAVLWRRGPATGTRHVPTADPRFRRNERIRLELPAPAGGPVIARLLDRRGALLEVPVTVSERIDTGDGPRWAVVDLTLAPLATGDYAIEVQHGDRTRVTAFRVVP